MNAKKAVTAHIDLACADIEALLATNIFSTEEADGPLFKAAYAWLILNVHIVLSELASTPNRITFPGNSDCDVTDLIQKARYAIVHAGAASKRNHISTPNKYRVSVGSHSGHSDDIAVCFGGVTVLVRRHAVRAYEAACASINLNHPEP